MQEVFVGVDVAPETRAEDRLDVAHPDHGARRIEKTPKAVRAFAASRAEAGLWIVFEASGGYDRLLREALEAAAVRFSRIDHRQARDVAEAMGVISKTERVDARLLAELGARLRPPATEPVAGLRRALRRASPVHHLVRHLHLLAPLQQAEFGVSENCRPGDW